MSALSVLSPAALRRTLLTWFKGLRIIVKLRLAFATMACITLLVGGAGLVATTLIQSRVTTAYGQDLPAIAAVKDAGISQLKAMRILLRVILAAGDNDEIEKQSQELKLALATERTKLNAAKAKVRSDSGRAQLLSVEKLLPNFEQGATSIVTSAKAGDVIGFRNTITDLIPLTDRIQHIFDQVNEITEAQATRSRVLTLLTYFVAIFVMTPTLVFCALLAALMSYAMSNLIARPLARMVYVLERMEKGDLTTSLAISSSDEMGQVASSLNNALSYIRSTLQQVGSSARELQSASSHLATTASSLAEGAETQAVSLQTTSSSLEEISATIRNNASNATRANEMGTSATRAAEQGDLAVNSAIEAMEQIKASSDEISTILSAIQDLSFQSNLLAVNASIEAARAGESGRSFTVVATEMRYLAERSKESAKLIERLVANSLERVGNGSQLVNQSGQALSQIMASVKHLSSTVDEIDIACAQQTKGVDLVTDAMSRVDAVVQANSEKTMHLSTTSQELAALAEALTKTLSGFVFEDKGARETAAARDDLDDSIDEAKVWAQSSLQRVRNVFSR